MKSERQYKRRVSASVLGTVAVLVALASSGCRGVSVESAPFAARSTPSDSKALTHTFFAMITSTVPSPTASLTMTPSLTPTASLTATPSHTPTASTTFTPSLTPTPVILRGEVNVERLSCRYGPGPMYLYLYALREGAVQEVIGRTDTGAWVLTRARGSRTVCWVNAKYLTLNGDVMLLPVMYPDGYRLPVSPYYSPPYNVRATRHGNTVTITWNAEPLKAGDEEHPDSPRFVVETWVCRDGRVVFTPLAAYDTIVTVTDEPGCAKPSRGRVFLAEKHGYAGPAEIPWP